MAMACQVMAMACQVIHPFCVQLWIGILYSTFPKGIILGLGGSLLLTSMWLIHKASDFVYLCCSCVVDTENKTIRYLSKIYQPMLNTAIITLL